MTATVTKLTTKNSAAQMAKHLINVVSDTYMLLIKTHGYHWNVTAPLFPQLHAFLETQYNELFLAADEVRIVRRGSPQRRLSPDRHGRMPVVVRERRRAPPGPPGKAPGLPGDRTAPAAARQPGGGIRGLRCGLPWSSLR